MMVCWKFHNSPSTLSSRIEGTGSSFYKGNNGSCLI